MFKKKPYPLALIPCNQVHTFFCKTPLDLYYINKEGTVIHKAAGVKPWRLAPYIKDSYMVLELPVPNDLKIETGQRVFEDGKWLF